MACRSPQTEHGGERARERQEGGGHEGMQKRPLRMEEGIGHKGHDTWHGHMRAAAPWTPACGHRHVLMGMCARRACRSLLTCVTTSLRAACLGAWCVGVGMCGTGGFRQLQSAPCRLSHRQCRDAVGHCVLGGWRAVRRVALRRFACLCPQYPGQPPRPRLGQLVSSSPSDLVPY